MQFWQPLRKMLDEVRYFFDRCPRWLKNEIFEQIFFRRNKIFEHVVWNCNKPTKFPDKLLKPFRWKSQIDWKTLRFLQQSFFLIKMTLWSGRLQFLQPRPDIFNIRSKKIVHCTKMIKNNSIFQKKKLEVFLWAQRKQFSQLRRKTFDEVPKNYRPRSQKEKKQYFFWKNLFEKMFVWARKKHFSQPRRQCFDKTPKHSTQNLKKVSYHLFLEKVIIRKYVFLDTLNAVVTMTPKSFQRGGETYSLNI